MTSEWRGITTSVLSNGMTTGPSHLCHPLLDLNLCRRFNAGTKPAEPTLKLRGLTLLVPTTSTWEVWICWTHLQPNISPPSNPVAGICTSSGTPSSSLKLSCKETMNRRQFQAQLACPLILVNKLQRMTIVRQMEPRNSNIRKPSKCSEETIQEKCTPPIGCIQGPSCLFPSEDRERTLQTLH